MKVILLRHGDALYQNNLSSMEKSTFHESDGIMNDFFRKTEQYDDLDPNKIDNITNKIHTLYNNELHDQNNIVIWTSPYGRTMQTAKILAQVLMDQKKNITKLSIIEQIGEVKNFLRQNFKAYVDGGQIDYNGEKIVIDKGETNPDNMNYTDYFFAGGYRASALPYMQDVETYEEISARSKRVLQRVSEIKKTLIDTLIIVTHQGWTDHVIVDKFGKEGYGVNKLQPGDYYVYKE